MGNSKLIIWILLTFVCTGVATGAGVYYWREQSVQNLENEVEELTEDVTEVEEEVCEEADGYAVVFTPAGLFTDEERETLTEKLVEPYFDYNLSTVSMQIEKLSEDFDCDDLDYLGGYGVDVIGISDEGTTMYDGFLFGDVDDVYEYWTPECFESTCSFTDEYRALHPEVVAETED